MSDRDCDNCAHHSEGGCSVWECIFTPKEDDTISRQAAIDAICGECQANCIPCESFPCGEIKAIQALPPVQPNLQLTCNQLATDAISRQSACEYCHEDSDGYVKPIEKNCHAFVRCSPIDGWILSLKYGSWRKDVQIRYCPMCGRRLER